MLLIVNEDGSCMIVSQAYKSWSCDCLLPFKLSQDAGQVAAGNDAKNLANRFKILFRDTYFLCNTIVSFLCGSRGGGVLRVLPLSLWRLDNNQTQAWFIICTPNFSFSLYLGRREGIVPQAHQQSIFHKCWFSSQSFALNAHFIVIGNHTVIQVLAFVNRILLELWKPRYEFTVYMCTNMAANCKVVTWLKTIYKWKQWPTGETFLK